MSALMRDWIGPAVQRELEAVLKGDAQDPQLCRLLGERGIFTAHLTEGKFIQVNEFISHSPQYVVWVSDSYTRIRASFAKSATEAFQKQHGRSFSKGIVGAVLGIKDYYLSQRVILKIESFTLQGSEGSGNFGRPTLAESIQKVGELLLQVSKLASSSRASSLDSNFDTASPVKSQAGSFSDDESPSEDATQAAFSTQAPIKRHTATIQKRNESSVDALFALLGAKHPKSHQSIADTRDSTPTARFPQIQETNIYSSFKDKEAPSEQSSSSINRPSSGTSHVPPQLLTESRAIRNTKQLHSKTYLELSQASSSLECPTNGDDVARDSRGIKGANSNNAVLAEPSLNDSEKENSQESREGNRAPIVPKTIIPQLNQRLVATTYQNEDDTDLWEELTRVPRKYVQIPKDQQNLLDRDDSWYPPTSGSRAIHVNVPPKVLQDLQVFYGGKASSELDAYDESDALVEGSHRGSEADVESESDVEVANSAENPFVQSVEDLSREDLSSENAADELGSSLEESDESSVEQPISWPPSQNEDETSLACETSQQKGLPEPAAEHQINVRALSKPVVSCGDVSSNAFRTVETPNTRKDAPEHGEQSFPPSERTAKRSSSREAARIVSPSSFRRTTFGPEPSSSPIEMEVSVPHALGDQVHPSDDAVMTDAFHLEQSVASTVIQTQSMLHVERTPHVDLEKLPAFLENLSQSLPIESDKKNAQLLSCLSSDPIIPCTFDSEAVEAVDRPVKSIKSIPAAGLHSHLLNFVSEANKVTSAACLSSVQLHFSTSQSPTRGEGIKNSASINMPSSPHKYVQVSIPATQISLSPAALPKNDLLIPEEAPSKQAMIAKRTAPSASEVFEPTPKRRRHIQAINFGLIHEEHKVVDIGEMAKANRRAFLEQLSLEKTEGRSIQCHNESHTSPCAPSSIASNAATPEPFSRDTTTSMAPTRQPNGDETSITCEASRGCETDVESNPERTDTLDLDKPLKSTEVTTAKPRVCNHNGRYIEPINTPSAENTEDTSTLVERFYEVYPTYSESKRTFIRACVYLEWLQSLKKAPHPSLWDDFVRAFSAEYSSYVKNCRLLGEKPMSGVDFYNEHVFNPVFKERVLTAARLQDALLLEPEETEKARSLFRRKSEAHRKQDPSSISPTQLMEPGKISTASQDTISDLFERSQQEQQTSTPITLRNGQVSNSLEEAQLVSSNIYSGNFTTAKKIHKKPFFETLSQLGAQDRFVNDNFRNREKSAPIQAGIARQSTRRLPWSSSPSTLSATEKLDEVTRAISLEPNHVSRSQLRQGSPILCEIISEQSITTSQSEAREIPPPLLTLSSPSRQNLVFNAPNLPASKALGLTTTSLPGPGRASLDRVQTWQDDKRHPSLTSTRDEKLAWKEITRIYVPRRKRVSSILSGKWPAVALAIEPQI